MRMIMKKIKINELEWKVFLVDQNHPKLADENAYGITHFRECEIYIDSELSPPLFKQIVTHELVHAVAFSYGVELVDATEEGICDFTAAHFDEIKTLRKAILKCI